jgi:hypothetical protein
MVPNELGFAEPVAKWAEWTPSEAKVSRHPPRPERLGGQVQAEDETPSLLAEGLLAPRSTGSAKHCEAPRALQQQHHHHHHHQQQQ